MMFGYATNETDNYMPATLDLAHLIMRTLADIRKEGKVMTYLRPDAKSQVTIEYSDNRARCASTPSWSPPSTTTFVDAVDRL
jgi:S-adenosylmethionine synthetase